MTTLADVIAGANKPYEPPETCPNCKGKGKVRVHVRANEYRLVPCPICDKDVKFLEDEYLSDVGC